jgi:hypothetical protein
MGRRERREQQRQLEKFRREQQRIAAAIPKTRWWRTALVKTYGLLGAVALLFGLIGFFFIPTFHFTPTSDSIRTTRFQRSSRL